MAKPGSAAYGRCPDCGRTIIGRADGIERRPADRRFVLLRPHHRQPNGKGPVCLPLGGRKRVPRVGMTPPAPAEPAQHGTSLEKWLAESTWLWLSPEPGPFPEEWTETPHGWAASLTAELAPGQPAARVTVAQYRALPAGRRGRTPAQAAEDRNRLRIIQTGI